MFSSNKDKFKKELIHDMLYHLAMWISDITALRDERKDIINSDFIDLLQKCSIRTIDWDDNSLAILKLIDDLHQKLDGNVNIQLILINLYNRLKAVFLET